MGLASNPVTNASTTIGGTSVDVLPANPTRNFLYIENPLISGNNIGFTMDGSTTAALGAAGTILLTPGNSILFDTFVPTNGIKAIATGASTPITIYWG